MHAENRVFSSVCAFGDFYAILSVKKSASGAPHMGERFSKPRAQHALYNETHPSLHLCSTMKGGSVVRYETA